MRRFAAFAWAVLAYNLGVVAWGAYVRATGSGAGCGEHWPTCQGALVPRSPSVETLIEYSHRLTSGLALVLTVGLLVGAWRTFARGHPARGAAVAATVLMGVEALLGAGLVLFGLVAGNTSLARGVVMPIHLVNTFLLLGALALTAWFASGGRGFSLRGQGGLGAALGAGVVGMMALGASGAIAALGDTLFPAASLAEGWRQDFSPAAHLFVKLRVLHPTIAVVVGVWLAGAAVWARLARRTPAVRRLATALVGLFALQLAAGIVNLLLLAPVWMQLLHLFLADLVWLALVLLSAAAFAARGAASLAPRAGELPERLARAPG